MRAKKERYYWKRGRMQRMANVRMADMPSTRSGGVVMKKIRSVMETVRIMRDKDIVNILRESKKDIMGGKTVPLRSLRK
jgi:hypothetical protein